MIIHAAYISSASSAQLEPGLAGEHGDERGHRGGVQQPLGAGLLPGGRRFPRSVGKSEVICRNLNLISSVPGAIICI